MGALWSGTKLADIFGSMMLLSNHHIENTVEKNHLQCVKIDRRDLR